MTLSLGRFALNKNPGEEASLKRPLPVISLFCGVGGLDLGFIQANFRPLLAIDKDSAACVTYEKNHPGVRVLRADLSKMRKGYVFDRLAELQQESKPIGVIGGPPCQAFSSSNRSKQKDDPRAQLPKAYARILRQLNSRYALDFFVFENVPGLRHKEHSVLFAFFKRLFAGAGFSIFQGELDAQNFGVAQVRKRLFVVGFNRKKYPALNFCFPNPSSNGNVTVRDAIGKVPKPLYFKRGLAPKDIPFHPNHWCMRPRSRKFFNGVLKKHHLKGRPFRVLRWNKASWTVAYGHREVHIHPSGRRRLSVYEAMLLQGFPRQYQLCGTLSDQIRLVSDAVPPPVAYALAKAIAAVLKNGPQTE